MMSKFTTFFLGEVIESPFAQDMEKDQTIYNDQQRGLAVVGGCNTMQELEETSCSWQN
jgi:hypothetical protein